MHKALRRQRPDLDIVGFGGDRMAAAGARLLYPLCQLAVMWFARVLANFPNFLSLLSRADPVFYFVPPRFGPGRAGAPRRCSALSSHPTRVY
jgi:hypothetical protein